MGQGILDHFGLVALGTLATQLVLGVIAFIGFYAVGKRIISVEIPGIIRDVNSRMEKLEKGLDTLHDDLKGLRERLEATIVTAAERQGALQTLSARVQWIEDDVKRRPVRSTRSDR